MPAVLVIEQCLSEFLEYSKCSVWLVIEASCLCYYSKLTSPIMEYSSILKQEIGRKEVQSKVQGQML